MRPDEVLTVLVLYEMRLTDSVALQTLTAALQSGRQSGRLLVYDNSASAQAVPAIPEWTIQYRHDPTNGGVSRAYNFAGVQAESMQLNWLLLADQDTTFPSDIFLKFHQASLLSPDCHVFVPTLRDDQGLVSPFRPRKTGGQRLDAAPAGLVSIREFHAVNSGMMVSRGLFAAAGGYDERLKLDFADFSFFGKLIRCTRYLAVVDATCGHELSPSKKSGVAQAVARFNIYRAGAWVMGQDGNSRFLFAIRIIFRTIKLSIQFRSFRFIGSLISSAS